jgi:hypothetical protein
VTDRSDGTVGKPLDEEPEYDEAAIRRMTPGERIGLVWELTVKEWQRRDPEWRESRMRRDIVRVIRPNEPS